MISRLTGAIARAVLVVLMIATPSLLLPIYSSDATEMVVLLSIFGAALTLFEYSSTYPGLIEFREAPPFNRIRFMSLFLTVFLLTVLLRGEVVHTAGTQFVAALGGVLADAGEFPYSPVRLATLMLGSGASQAQVDLVRASTGLAYLISLLMLTSFVIAVRVMGWPSRGGVFNVWINLPTFDPTAQGDIVQRLERDARINIMLGFVLPFLTPAAVNAAGAVFGSISLSNPHTLIWTVSAWAFLPASLFMRGIAMGRISAMIAEKRRRQYAQMNDDIVVV